MTGDSEYRSRPIARTIAFIAGFSAVFIVLSIIFSATITMMSGVSRLINIISGIIVIVLGLNIIFNFLSVLNYEKRLHLKNKPKGIIGAFAAGGAFGAGWTPCVGPVLAGILLLAANSGGISRAIVYLIFYSVGLGLPFLLASFFFNVFVTISAKLRSWLPLIQRISGVLLIIIGILIITGRYQALSAMTAKWQPLFSEKAPAAEAAASGQKIKIPDNVVSALREAGLQAVDIGIDPVDFTLPMINGSNVSLSQFKGKVVFLNFWASWCGPCRSEMPSMEAVYQKLNHEGFEILAVNLGDSKNEVSVFLSEYNFSFPILLDEKNTVGSYYNVQALPTTYIVDRQGLIIARLVGSVNWDTPKALAAFEAALRY